MSSESLPSSMEVVGHHVDEVQFPGDGERQNQFLKIHIVK